MSASATLRSLKLSLSTLADRLDAGEIDAHQAADELRALTERKPSGRKPSKKRMGIKLASVNGKTIAEKVKLKRQKTYSKRVREIGGMYLDLRASGLDQANALARVQLKYPDILDRTIQDYATKEGRTRDSERLLNEQAVQADNLLRDAIKRPMLALEELNKQRFDTIMNPWKYREQGEDTEQDTE